MTNYQQEDYRIGERHYENSRVRSVIRYRMNEIMKEQGNLNGAWALEEWLEALKEKEEEGLTPAQFSGIVGLLLDYVPDKVKEF